MNKRIAKALNTKLIVARALFFVNTLIWLGLAAYVLYDMAVINTNRLPAILVGVFMLGNAAMMLVSAIMLGKRQTWAYYFAILVLAVNIILTFTDQFGFWDLLTLIIDLILFGILLSIRKPYLSNS
jgi:hypothetical protein